MNKPARTYPRPLSELLGKTLGDAFRRQGFASTELVTRWREIVGPEFAEHCEPEKIRWARPVEGEPPEPGTLALKVEGPMALEIQQASGIILERVNRFFGWQAVDAIRLRQAPLSRRQPRAAAAGPSPEAQADVAATLTQVDNEDLREALARLGAAVKGP